MTTYKTRTAQDYITLALSCIQDDQTFAAKSHKKDALTLLNRGYEVIRERNFGFSRDNLSREDYFSIPFDLHQIREKHKRLFDASFHKDLQELVELRVLLKFLDVVKPAPKTERIIAKQAEVTKTVMDLIDRRMAQYHEAVEMGRLFGGLNVSVTPHQVTNEHNTTFTRCFYFLEGKFTPLQVIMAAMDTLAAEKKARS